MTNHYVSNKYMYVTRMLYSTKLKYWYYFSKLGQSLGAAHVQEQSTAPRVTHPSWHLLLPSALQPIRKYWQTPRSLPAPCPCRQAEKNLQINNHSPLPHCSVAALPKTEQTVHSRHLTAAAQPLTPAWYFDQEQRRIAFCLQSEGFAKKRGKKKNTATYVFNVSIWNIMFVGGI